jgi:hypothetical protein
MEDMEADSKKWCGGTDERRSSGASSSHQRPNDCIDGAKNPNDKTDVSKGGKSNSGSKSDGKRRRPCVPLDGFMSSVEVLSRQLKKKSCFEY